jgi:hypothetical protein
VIGEVEPINAKKVTRVIFCSGKIYYELVAARHERKIAHIAIARLEQLYPFPQESFQEEAGEVSEGHRNRLVSGRAAQSGRLVLDRLASAPVALAQRQAASAARLPPGIRFPGGWLCQQAQRPTKGSDRLRAW